MSNSVYREKSLERISSPEKMDDYIKVSNPSVWVIILALFILLGGFGYWCIRGSLPTTISPKGVSTYSSSSGKMVDTVVGFISNQDYNKLTSAVSSGKNLSDIKVEVTPNGSASKYGHISGSIISIGSTLTSVEGAVSLIGDESIAKSVMPDSGSGIEIRVKLNRDESRPTLLDWSGDNSDGNAKLLEDTICELKIITQEESPASFLFS